MFENSNILSSVKEKFIPPTNNNEEEDIIDEIDEDDSNEIEEKNTNNKKTKEKSKKKETRKDNDLPDQNETEIMIKNFIEKYKFLIKGFTSMKIIDALEALIPKMTNKKSKNSIKDLIKKADKIGIADLLVNSLGIK